VEYKLFYSPYYYADIGEGHVFPIRKFELVKDILLAEGTLTSEEIISPEEVKREDLHLFHTEDYISRQHNSCGQESIF
jgi:acetoin utilization deacetylase AcuC-like enzyme